jgi:hypothetical protein
LIFEVGDFVYLKVPSMRGMKRFKVNGKLSPRYIGPFKILERKGEVAYQIELPDSLSDVHDVFHVSQLKKCLRVTEEQLPMEELNVNEDFTYSEYPVKILEISRRITRSKVINMCKVQWSHHSEDGSFSLRSTKRRDGVFCRRLKNGMYIKFHASRRSELQIIYILDSKIYTSNIIFLSQ